MKKTRMIALLLALPTCPLCADTFGTVNNGFTMDFVPITGGMIAADLPNPPASVVSGTSPNTAVYKLPISTGPADITQAGGLSPFGTMA